MTAAAPGGRSAGPTVTDQEITIALHSILREEANPNPNSGPTVTTFNDVFRQLQSKLGVDLFHKLDFIRSQIQLLLRFPAAQPRPPPQAHPSVHVPPTKDHFVFHSPHAYPPHHLSNFHPSPSAFHTFPLPVGHHHNAQVQFQSQAQAQAHPQLYPVASRAEPPPKESAPVKPKRKAATGGLSKLCRVSPELQAIVGQPAMPRTEIVRQLWAYIRKNNLQDPSNKRKIICNEELRLVFETDSTDMFKMNKLLAKHIGRLEPTEESEAKKLKVEAEPEPEVKSSIEPSPVKISEALSQFFGVNETEMLEPEITERLSQYINLKQLQDSENSSLIRCDAKLQEILGRESILAQEIPDVLADRNHIRR
ncbi:hypothetical protein MLD38_034254 [Melastoma candidum]|uniref:Uncharacterized protein n=1 Tax=Melastoma candidum TaxID=119954 RepID=A0ACB9MBP6_9MYRT|nr:hypothetical protein MLD38_034254 [Melastoma candidum]